jgi:hypothetical protein
MDGKYKTRAHVPETSRTWQRSEFEGGRNERETRGKRTKGTQTKRGRASCYSMSLAETRRGGYIHVHYMQASRECVLRVCVCVYGHPATADIRCPLAKQKRKSSKASGGSKTK